jgi:hypothetical protein
MPFVWTFLPHDIDVDAIALDDTATSQDLEALSIGVAAKHAVCSMQTLRNGRVAWCSVISHSIKNAAARCMT